MVPSLHTFLKSATSLPIRAFGKVKIFTGFFTKCSNSHRVRRRQTNDITNDRQTLHLSVYLNMGSLKENQVYFYMV